MIVFAASYIEAYANSIIVCLIFMYHEYCSRISLWKLYI